MEKNGEHTSFIAFFLNTCRGTKLTRGPVRKLRKEPKRGKKSQINLTDIPSHQEAKMPDAA